ncbi:MAG: BON domain-containing protein [Thermogutta sp.]
MWTRRKQVTVVPLMVLALLEFGIDAVKGQTYSSGLFGTQNLGLSLSGQPSTRISGSNRSSSLGSSGLSTMSSGQFLNFQSVNQAAQFFGSDSFVGADSGDVVNWLSGIQGTSRSGLTSGLTGRTTTGLTGRTTLGSNLMGFGNRGLLGSRTGSGYSQTMNRTQYGTRGRTQQDVIRSAVRIGFTAPAGPDTDAVSAGLAARLSRSLTLHNAPQAANVQVNLEGRTAVLKGTVPTADARLVLERLLLLEPGVDKVQNELVVAGSNP